MAFYLILLSSLMGIGFLLNYFLSDKSGKYFLAITFAILFTVSSVRFAVGYDYLVIYNPAFKEVVGLNLFEIVSSYLVDESDYTFVGRHEIAYVLLQYMITLFSTDFRALYFVTSFIIISLVCLFFYKYSKDKVLAVFLYMSLGLFYSSMNFIRQNIAALIVSFAIMQIKEKNWKKYFLLVILAGLFHKSAFFMLPFYFILQIRLTSVVLALYSISTILFLLLSDYVIDFAITRFFPWYAFSSNLSFIEDGISLVYLVIPVIIFIVLFVFNHLFYKDMEYIFINVAFFNMFFFILGAKHFIIERFSLLFQFVIILAIINLIEKIKDYNYYNLTFALNYMKSKAYSVLPYAIVFSLGLWFNCLLLTVDGHYVVPYQTIFGDLYKWYTRL